MVALSFEVFLNMLLFSNVQFYNNILIVKMIYMSYQSQNLRHKMSG